ncbi:MAG TPA: hypothetical protein VGG75_37250 [Trebonia sp.]
MTFRRRSAGSCRRRTSSFRSRESISPTMVVRSTPIRRAISLCDSGARVAMFRSTAASGPLIPSGSSAAAAISA